MTQPGTYHPGFYRLLTAILLQLILLWFTVSLPVVYRSMNQLNATEQAQNLLVEEEGTDDCNNNSSEEKVPAGVSLAEEFLHHGHEWDGVLPVLSRIGLPDHTQDLNSFSGELLSPPPEHFTCS